MSKKSKAEQKQPQNGKKTKGKVNKRDADLNIPLLNAVTPSSINFERNTFGFGENYCKGYVITRYNNSPDLGWLSQFTSIPNTFFTINFAPITQSDLLENINKNINKDKAHLRTVKDEIEISRLEQKIEDTMWMIREIDQKNSNIIQTSILLCAAGQTYDEMAEIAREIETTAAVCGCKVTPVSWGQEDLLKGILPYYRINDYAHKIGSKLMPMKTVQGGFPQASSHFKDPNGFVIGVEHTSRKSCLLDPWIRGGNRSNGNIVFLGKPGQGKSTALKWVMANMHATGTRIICIDPEREYKEMCQNFGGDWLDCGGDNQSRINPLQIVNVPLDDDADQRVRDVDLEKVQMRSLSNHLKKLETFVRLYIRSISDYEMAALKEVIIELYAQWGITFDTDVTNFKNEDFPVFSNLYDLLLKYAERYRTTHGIEKENYYENLALLFKDIATGSDACLWNGPTTLSAHSSFVCLDTNMLGDSADNIRRAQYFNVLSWTWEQMSRDRNEKVFLVCDETYLMIDPRVPQSLVFLRDVSKRARKYEGGVGIVSHSVSDFLDPAIKMYGQPLLDNPTYKFMFGTDGQNLKDVSYLYNLNETEGKTLEKQQQGTALFGVGGNKFVIDIVIPPWFFELMGKAGGRGAETASVK